MSRAQLIFGLLLLAAILAALISGVIFGLGWIRRLFDTLNPETGIVLGVSAFVALVCAWMVAAAIRSAKRCDTESRLYSERAVIYKSFLDALAARAAGNSSGLRNGIVGDLAEAEIAVFLRGSATVNVEYRALQRLLSDVDPDDKAVRSQITRLLLALRRDCGQSTSGLEEEDWSNWLHSD